MASYFFSFNKTGYLKKAGMRNFWDKMRACPIRSGARMEIQTLKETIMGDFIVTTTNATMLPQMGKNIYSVLQALKRKL